MSKLGEQIRAKTSNERTRIEVAEWGDDEPLVLYAGELLCGEFNKLQKKAVSRSCFDYLMEEG